MGRAQGYNADSINNSTTTELTTSIADSIASFLHFDGVDNFVELFVRAVSPLSGQNALSS